MYNTHISLCQYTIRTIGINVFIYDQSMRIHWIKCVMNGCVTVCVCALRLCNTQHDTRIHRIEFRIRHQHHCVIVVIIIILIITTKPFVRLYCILGLFTCLSVGTCVLHFEVDSQTRARTHTQFFIFAAQSSKIQISCRNVCKMAKHDYCSGFRFSLFRCQRTTNGQKLEARPLFRQCFVMLVVSIFFFFGLGEWTK